MNWTLFTDEKGGFRILTPNAFTAVSKPLHTTTGDTEVHTFYTFASLDSAQYFSVSYYDLPSSPPFLSDSLTQDLLMTIKRELLNAFHADEAYSAPLALRRGSGLLFRAGYNQAHQVMKAQVRIYPPRVFILQVLLPHEMALSPASERFFDSFEYTVHQTPISDKKR